MKLSYITFMVRDIERTVDFYREFAGLAVMRRFNPGPGEIVFMADDAGSTALEFIQFEQAEKVKTAGMTMSFCVADDLAELRDRLAKAGYRPSEILEQPPKPAHFVVADPDGIPVEFTR